MLGIALSGPVADRARVLVWPMRDLFAAMFFFFFALRIDLGDVPPVLVPAIALIAIACVAKTATGWIVSAGLDVEARLRAGTALIAQGEFSIVIAGLAVSSNLGPDLAALAATLVLGTAPAPASCGGTTCKWPFQSAAGSVAERGGSRSSAPSQAKQDAHLQDVLYGSDAGLEPATSGVTGRSA